MIEIRWFCEYMTDEKMRERGVIGTAYDYGNYFPRVLQYREGDGDWKAVEVIRESK